MPRSARWRGALVHISTDYVFDGHSPLRTANSPTNPLSAYGTSKLAGELLIKRHLDDYFIIRTSGLYGVRGSSVKGYTFIERILTQAGEGRPLTWLTTLRSRRPILSRSRSHPAHRGARLFGTYHVTNTGQCTWYDFAREILLQAGITTELRETTSERFPTLARRPKFSALRHGAMDALGFPRCRAGAKASATTFASVKACPPASTHKLGGKMVKPLDQLIYHLDLPNVSTQIGWQTLTIKGWVAHPPPERLAEISVATTAGKQVLALCDRPDVRMTLPKLSSTGFESTIDPKSLTKPVTISFLFEDGTLEERLLNFKVPEDSLDDFDRRKAAKLKKILEILRCPACSGTIDARGAGDAIVCKT